MITLTKLNGQSFTYNAVYIEQVQSNPDTTITTAGGRTYLVLESEEEVALKVTDYFRSIGLIQAVDKAGE